MWRKCIGAIVTTVAILAAGGALAQSDYPNHTVKIVVPTPPGPTLDSLPRLIASHLSERWKVPVIIENIPGAAQNLGAEAVAKAAPDGYTLLAAPKGPLVISQYEYTHLNFDPDAFVPVSVFVSQTTALVASPSAPFSTLQEMIAYAKANPGRINYGSPGTGSSPQLMIDILDREAGIHMTHVPYKGIAPAEADLMAGHIDLMVDPLGSAYPYIKDGRFKVLAVTSKTRIPDMPNVPTVAETFPDYVFTEWFAFVAPPKTDPAIAARISQAVAEIVRSPEVAQKFRDVSMTPVGSTPAETAALVKEESARWQKAIKDLGIKIEN